MSIRIPSRSHALPHFDDRAAGQSIDTIVIHSLSAEGHTDKFEALNCIQTLDSCKVSAHYLITRDGEVWKLVEEEKRAWHAGESKMPFPDDHRQGVNHFSIGIELIGTEQGGFTEEQYVSLAAITKDIAARHPIRTVVGHNHIAPSRKSDPGVNFNWKRYEELVALPHIRFGV